MVMDKLAHYPGQSPWFRHLPTIGLLAGLMLVSGGAGWWFSQITKQEKTSAAALSVNSQPPLLVKTTIVRQQSIDSQRVLTGTVEPVEKVTLTSRVMGQIRDVTVQEGDRVTAGEVLAVIDVADIQAQNSQALAGVSIAQSNYQAAEARLQQARGQLLEAEAQLADAQLEQRRMAALRAEGAVSQQVLDKANTMVKTIQARIQQINASISQTQSTLDQAQAQVQQSQAQVAQVSANLDYGTIVAPFDGVVTHKHTDVGAMAGPGQSIVTLESNNRLRFSAQVPESLIGQVKQGQSVSVYLDAIDRKVPGVVSQIIPAADPSTRNFTVKVNLNLSSASGVIPGMFGRLQLTSQTAAKTGRTALVIPQSAIVHQFGITGVYKVVDGRASFQAITTGKTYGTDIEVFSGLAEGDRLVLEPTADLKDGIAVQG